MRTSFFPNWYMEATGHPMQPLRQSHDHGMTHIFLTLSQAVRQDRKQKLDSLTNYDPQLGV